MIPANNIGSVIVDLKDVSINSEDRTFLKGDVRIEFNAFFGRESCKMEGIADGAFGNTGLESIQFQGLGPSLLVGGLLKSCLMARASTPSFRLFFMVNDAMRRTDNTISLLDGKIYSPKDSSTGGFTDPSMEE